MMFMNEVKMQLLGYFLSLCSKEMHIFGGENFQFRVFRGLKGILYVQWV